MTHLGVYYAPEHTIPDDLDYIQKLQPKVIRLLDCDVQQIATMHALAPNAIIAPRTWAIDDNNGDAVRKLMSDPQSAGVDHAQQYAGQWNRWQDEARQRGLVLPPADRIYFNAANEPNQGGTPDKIAAYTVAFLNRCTELGLRATALCLGVGWPDNTGPDTPVNWQPYASIVEPIRRGSHWLELHEYNYKTGPQDGWTWLAGRHLQCPFDVPICLGEIGIDNYVDKARWDKEGGNRGWQGNVTPDQYAEMIEWHISHSDTRVIAALIFITDVRNREWQSFNTRGAHQALLARKDAMDPQAKPSTSGTTTHIPALGNGPTQAAKTMFVNAPNGLNVRKEPATGDIVTVAQYGDAVQVLTTEATGGVPWSRVVYGGVEGWMFTALLSATAPASTPAPTQPVPTQPVPTQPVPAQPGDNFQRALAFVRKWEGGWADNPADPGGATNKGITIGTFIKWRVDHGQPTPTKDDLRAIPDAEVDAIYRDWYWQASGADRLPWPLALAQFDTAVNGGVGKAQEMLQESNGNFLAYVAHLIEWYASIQGFETFGRAWMRRRADLLREASK